MYIEIYHILRTLNKVHKNFCSHKKQGKKIRLIMKIFVSNFEKMTNIKKRHQTRTKTDRETHLIEKFEETAENRIFGLVANCTAKFFVGLNSKFQNKIFCIICAEQKIKIQCIGIIIGLKYFKKN